MSNSLIKPKKYIQFTLSQGIKITVDEEQAKDILKSTQQLIPIVKNGEWTGETINKAHIVATKRDYEEERNYYREEESKAQREEERKAKEAYEKLSPEEKEAIRINEEESRKKMRELYKSFKLPSVKQEEAQGRAKIPK